jgi:ankyrin repeat protein
VDDWIGGLPPLIKAAALGDLQEVSRLLAAGESPNAIDEHNLWTALHAAAGRRRHEIVSLLLSAGADPHLMAGDDVSPLFNAAGPGDEESVRLLLQSGADPRSRDSRTGGEPLHAAAEWGNAPTARLLIDAGADVNALDDYGGSPLMDAAESGDLDTVELLLDSGADPSASRPPERGGALVGLRPEALAERLGFADIAALITLRS